MKKVFNNNSEVNDVNSSNDNVTPGTSTPETSTPETVFPKWIDDKSIDAGEYTAPMPQIFTSL